MNHRIFLIPILYLAVLCSPATAATLTFEELPHAAELQEAGNIVIYEGYTIKYTPAPKEPYPVGFFTVGPTWRFNDGSTALTANSCSATTRLTSNNSNPLKLLSIDLNETNGDNNGRVTFIGITADRFHRQVKKTVRLNGTPDWQTFHFPAAFANLESVSWKQGDCLTNPPHMFDNIQVLPTTNTVVLSFEELPHDAELQGAEDTVTTNGYTLEYTPAPNEPYPVGFTTIGPSWRFNDRSTALTANSCSAETKLTSDDNQPFKLLSIDLDETNGDNGGLVTFIGITATPYHQRVTETVRLNGTPDWQTFNLPATFTNLISVSWTQGDCIDNPPHMFDNIRLKPSQKSKPSKVHSNWK